MFSRFKQIFLLGSVLLFTGCNSTLVVYNSNLDQIESLFKDYAGLNGYQFTYQNDSTKSYRLRLGTLFVPHSSQTKQTYQGNRQLDRETKGLTNLVAYEQTTVETISQPAHYVEANAKVRLVQQNNDVLIYLETDGPLGTSMEGLQEFIQQTGYRVENR